NGLRRDVVVARETAAVAHDRLLRNRGAPRRDLSLYDCARAVGASGARLLQRGGSKQHLRDLMLRWLHQRFEDFTQRRRREGRARIEARPCVSRLIVERDAAIGKSLADGGKVGI